MARLICALAALMCLAAPSEVRAQAWQGSVLFGTTPGSALDRRAAALDTLEVGSGFTWGLQVSRLVTPHLAAELSWMTHWSGLEIGTAAGKAHLFEMTVNQLHGNAVFRLRDPAARTRPFVFAGLGTTFLNALGQPSESRLSFGMGAGAEVFFSKWGGVRAQFRYKPTPLGDEDAGDFCDPFGFCQGTLQQIELSAGLTMRF
ncbi:MAG TPA: outer membrane beta-barrel protein [Vicinamibacterales bacterium]